MIFQTRITRDDLRANRSVLYLFGDNETRLGYGGQAAEMRGEPNAVGICVKRRPSMAPDALWTDAEYDRAVAIIEADMAPAFSHAEAGGIIICPRAGVGTNRARLLSGAPRIWAYLRTRLADLHRLDETRLKRRGRSYAQVGF
jgi:hypothetical protein